MIILKENSIQHDTELLNDEKEYLLGYLDNVIDIVLPVLKQYTKSYGRKNNENIKRSTLFRYECENLVDDCLYIYFDVSMCDVETRRIIFNTVCEELSNAIKYDKIQNWRYEMNKQKKIGIVVVIATIMFLVIIRLYDLI